MNMPELRYDITIEGKFHKKESECAYEPIGSAYLDLMVDGLALRGEGLCSGCFTRKERAELFDRASARLSELGSVRSGGSL